MSNMWIPEKFRVSPSSQSGVLLWQVGPPAQSSAGILLRQASPMKFIVIAVDISVHVYVFVVQVTTQVNRLFQTEWFK